MSGYRVLVGHGAGFMKLVCKGVVSPDTEMVV